MGTGRGGGGGGGPLDGDEVVQAGHAAKAAKVAIHRLARIQCLHVSEFRLQSSKPSMRLAALLCFAIVMAPGCTSSNSPTPAANTTCQSTVIALCKAACSCATTDVSTACALGTHAGDAGGGSLGWPNEGACELYFAFACGEAGPPAGFSYEACNASLNLTSCVTTVNGPALAFPASCNVSVPDGGAEARM
jgi:hypothetical protein